MESLFHEVMIFVSVTFFLVTIVITPTVVMIQDAIEQYKQGKFK